MSDTTARVQLPVIPSTVPTHDNTMMSDWAYCERKYALAHLLGIKRREIAFPLSFGSLIHKGLDAYYSTLRESELASGKRDVIAAATAMQEAMESTDYIDPADGHRTKARAIKVMFDYVKHYQEDSDLQEILFTETPFNVEQPDGFRWGGIIDLWGRYHHNNWPIDHKTTSQFGQYFYDDFRRAPQFLGYQEIGSDLHGVRPAGVLLNVIVIRKNDHQFDRRPMIFSDWLGAEAKQMQIQNYWRINDARERSETALRVGAHSTITVCFDAGVFTPNFYNCVGKYGRCPYYDLCEARPENRERVVANEYEENKWDWTKERE